MICGANLAPVSRMPQAKDWRSGQHYEQVDTAPGAYGGEPCFGCFQTHIRPDFFATRDDRLPRERSRARKYMGRSPAGTQDELVNQRSYLLETASLAHCKNFSAAGLSPSPWRGDADGKRFWFRCETQEGHT